MNEETDEAKSAGGEKVKRGAVPQDTSV